jgi:hypothetical protein
MIPMLLVVGSLVPVSDSPNLTIAPARPAAMGAVVDVRNLVRPGMHIGEAQRLLGQPKAQCLVTCGGLLIYDLGSGALVIEWSMCEVTSVEFRKYGNAK